ncbi:hypothetical protein ACFL6W_04170 [Thermodesulfobacteriota bacterium]
MNPRSSIITVFTLFMLFSSAAVSGDESIREAASWANYRVLSERNIFSRNRVKINRSQFIEPVNIQREPEREEGYLILRGVTKQSDRFIAFIEDSRTMEMKKVFRDGMIGKGKVRDITLDYITYELEGKSARVNIGMTMGGDVAQKSLDYAGGFESPKQQEVFTFPSTGQAGKSEVKPSAENVKDILQRLKERRKKELGE